MAIVAIIALVAVAFVGVVALGGPDDDAGISPVTEPDQPAASTSAVSDEFPVQSLTWSECHRGLECATVDVPLDHDDPAGRTITLALARRPAEEPHRRIGSLLINPGGPGGSGIATVEWLRLHHTVMERFDIVGFDPRGVGESSPIDCHTHLQAIYDADPTIDGPAERDVFLTASQAFVDECDSKHSDLLPHLGTVNVAKDLEVIRRALGEEKLNFLGYSYGSSIGHQYLRMYPDRVRAMVIDGIVDPAESGMDAAQAQAEAFSESLDHFAWWCDVMDCGIGGPAMERIDAVIARAETAAIPSTNADRPAGPGVVSMALSMGLYNESLWPSLGRNIDRALGGDGTGLVQLADSALERDGEGNYSNFYEIYFSVGCIDTDWPKDPDQILAEGARIGGEHPRLGEAIVNDYVRCALWPSPPQPLESITPDSAGIPPIVVVSTTGDPATPHVYGQRVAERIPNATLITYDGWGHTIVGRGDLCVDRPVADYFVKLVVPDEDLYC